MSQAPEKRARSNGSDPETTSPKKLNQSSSGHFSQTANVQLLDKEDFKELLRAIHGHNLRDSKPIPERAVTDITYDPSLRVLPVDLEGVNPFANVNPTPSSIAPDKYKSYIAGCLWKALKHILTKQYLHNHDLYGLSAMIFNGVPKGLLTWEREEPGSSFQLGLSLSFRQDLTDQIIRDDASFIWIYVQLRIHLEDTPEPQEQPQSQKQPTSPGLEHWLGTLYWRRRRLLIIFDSIPSPRRAAKVLREYVKLWNASGIHLEPPSRVAIALTPTQDSSWSCGLWMADIAATLFRYPRWYQREMMTMKAGQYEIAMSEKWEGFIRKYLGLKSSRHDANVAVASPLSAGPASPAISTEASPAASPMAEPNRLPPSLPTPISEILDTTYRRRPEIGPDRVAARRKGEYTSPYRWVYDTNDIAGRRPEPHFPQGWKGWADHLVKVKESEDAMKEVEQKEKDAKYKALAEKRERVLPMRKAKK